VGTGSRKEGTVADEVNKSLPEGAVQEEDFKAEDLDAAATGESDEHTPSQGIPEVPTYPEEKSQVVYPKECRTLSLNFQRAIG